MRYTLIDQKKYCCVPAVLLMVFMRRGIESGLHQEAIAVDLGLTIPPKDSSQFPDATVTDKKPVTGYGTKIQHDDFSLEKFVNQRELPLNIKKYSIEDIVDLAPFIGDNLAKNCDIIVMFNFKELFRIGSDGGHAMLIDHKEGDRLFLLDSDIKYLPRIKSVSTVKLKNAITNYEKVNGGRCIYVIAEKINV